MAKNKTTIAPHYTKVGRIGLSISRKANIPAADIYISDNHLEHIKLQHGKDLSRLGFTANEFVNVVVGSFDQIRKGSGQSLLLVVYNEELLKVAAIELNYSLKKRFWEIKTATPMRVTALGSKSLIWQRERTP